MPAALLLLVLALACSGPVEHEGTGDVVALDADARTVTLRHDDIPGVMGAMTMRFPVQSAGVLAGVEPRDRVRFALRRRGGEWIVVRMRVEAKATPQETAEPGVHDHTPHHGGVVGMSGTLHLEALARPDGTVRVWLTDFLRKPRSLDGVTGRVTVELPAGDRTLTLRRAGDALEVNGPPIAEAEVTAHVELTVDGEAVEMDFLLPTAAGATGAAAVPTAGCVPVPAVAGTRTPRCAIAFGRPVTALAATPDGATLLVAAVDAGVSAWRLPAGTLLHGFEQPPPLVVPDARALTPHPEGANAIAVSPDGREAAVAIENRLLRYDVATGRLLRELPARAGVVRDVAWSPDGASLVVVTFYDASARLLRADTGIEWGRLPVTREASAAAFAPDGRTVAVGDETGALVLFGVHGGEPRTLTTSGRAVGQVAFGADRLVVAREGGAVEVRRPDGGLERELAIGGPGARIALTSDFRTLAASGAAGALHIIEIVSSGAAEIRGWHTHPVSAVAWTSHGLVSADTAGSVALWD